MSVQSAQPPQSDPDNVSTSSGQPLQANGGTEVQDPDQDSGDDSDAIDDDGLEPDEILSAYRHLRSRRVDLVGDYAGDERFLIEGDSMLLRCFDDDKLDMHDGLQLLHAVYNVEHFLHNLVKRKCIFNIVFFQSNRECCLPPNADPVDNSKYFLARACIIRHLKTNLQSSHPDIAVDIFDSWWCDDFLKYLKKLSPYFLMAHDGAAAAERKNRRVSKSADKVRPTKRLLLREMILYFITRGYNTALVNGLEWRDTKVMTMVLEPRYLETGFKVKQPGSSVASGVSIIDVSSELQKLSKINLTDRQVVLALTVCRLHDKDVPGLSAESKAGLCAALLLHQALATNIPLSSRRLPTVDSTKETQAFLSAAAETAESILQSASWEDDDRQRDIMDLLDGRLFLQVTSMKPKVNPATRAMFDTLLQAVQAVLDDKTVGNHDEATSSEANTNGMGSADTSADGKSITVLPFSNKVFDRHLESVRIKVNAANENERSLAARKIFQEVSHWHNYKRPLVQKAPQPVDARAVSKAAKREQLFMAEMAAYAASLTNSVGKILEPETIIVGVPRQSKIKAGTESPADSEMSDSGASSASSKTKPGQKKGGGGKNAAKNAGKQAMLNQIAAVKAKKDESANDKIASSWRVVCKGFEADLDIRSRYRKCKEYLVNLQASWKEVVGGEIELYLVSCLLLYWIEACRTKEKSNRIQVVALIWSHLRSISQSGSLSPTVVKCLQLTVTTLGLPPIPESSEMTSDRKLAFTFALPSKTADLTIGVASKEFQLLQCGPYLERSFDSRPDPRVEFQPDAWQRKVLDAIDLDQSVMAVAPTSAGKTFISFYAMRKVLEADDDSVLVYVAPTKALVNQIAAEIQARYSKKFKYGGKSVWAIHTRDYRINNPNGCQVLVTVPHVLQIMLLAPSNANSWSSRVKRIIFDEIHSIGQAEDGVVWEQLLLMAPCPIIALSATVGNPQEFSDWLGSTQTAIGKQLVTVQHPYRYSDLRKYYYVPPTQFAFRGIPEKKAFGSLGLEGLTGFNFVHPVAGLVDKSRGIPEDLALEPRDCLLLWRAMSKVQTDEHPIPGALDPVKSLPAVSRKIDVLQWEKALKVVLRSWLEDATSPYDALLRELETTFRDSEREDVYATNSMQAVQPIKSKISAELLTKSTLPMLCRLQEQDALPAILFNYDRHMCEKVCQAVVTQLQEAEVKQRKSGPKWEKTLEDWEEWKKAKDKANSRTAKVVSKKTKKDKDDEDEEKSSKLDMQRDAAGGDDTKWESFDPDAPASGYHFADHTRAQASEIGIYVRQLQWRKIEPYLVDALIRGVGVHHAGMNRKYRQVVEILFRRRFLTVIIATGTLALGINMPCKTVVFSGDSVFLTALNFRQCAGRAGRRGFDLLGNVVFQGVSRDKVCRLISSRLPDLNGHFPITTTLVLRLFTLLHESKESRYAVSAVNALLSQPRLYMGGASFKDATMHHLRFSIEYLRRLQLLGSDGAPLNFAGLVSHLYFTENSAFAFHALLKEGYFHELCSNIATNEKQTMETLMLIMSHLFSRISCRQADEEYRQNVVKPSSSIVFLPPMPQPASKILLNHNRETLQVYKAYVRTFVDQHLANVVDHTLPLTGIAIGMEDGSAPNNLENLDPTKVRSPFVALSGAGDDFASIHDLCHTVRDGVFLEEAVIPHVDLYPEEMETPLNAYLLDFFKHGDVMTIERANGVRRSEIWFLLNDFSLILATIVTSLMNFMKLSEGTDMDMLDIMGRMDAHEEEEDDRIAVDQQSEASGPSIADSGVVMVDRSTRPSAPTKKQAKNADSWEDFVGDDDAVEVDSVTEKELGAQAQANAQELWDARGDEGLRNVLKAFQKLHAEFNVRFKAMWA